MQRSIATASGLKKKLLAHEMDPIQPMLQKKQEEKLLEILVAMATVECSVREATFALKRHTHLHDSEIQQLYISLNIFFYFLFSF